METFSSVCNNWSFTTLWWNFASVFFAELFELSHIGGVDYEWPIYRRVTACQLDSSQVSDKATPKPSETKQRVFQSFRGGLAGEFQIIVLLRMPSVELEVTTWWPGILLQDFLVESKSHGSINYGKSSRSWSCKAAPDLHTTTTCWYDVLFTKYCVRFTNIHLPKRSAFVSLIHRIFGITKMFFGKCEMSLYVLYGQQWLLSWNSLLDAILLFLCVESWTLN